MTEYWKSLPKKYCDACKCWFTDNRASVEFHERGFSHQANVRKKLSEVRQRNATQLDEQKKYNIELMKIEAAAMSSFQQDISNNPKLSRELGTTKSFLSSLPTFPDKGTASTSGGRFGDEGSNDEGESMTLVRGRERALDTISKKLEKKSKWLESKTAEGKTYFWNKETFDTKWKKPKCGFLSIDEQKAMNISGPSTESPTATVKFKHVPYGRWQTISDQPFEDNMPDLELPGQKLPEFVAPVSEEKKEKVKEEFKERTVESVNSKRMGGTSTSTVFKKRKNTSEMKRNVRRRDDDD